MTEFNSVTVRRRAREEIEDGVCPNCGSDTEDSPYNISEQSSNARERASSLAPLCERCTLDSLGIETYFALKIQTESGWYEKRAYIHQNEAEMVMDSKLTRFDEDEMKIVEKPLDEYEWDDE